MIIEASASKQKDNQENQERTNDFQMKLQMAMLEDQTRNGEQDVVVRL